MVAWRRVWPCTVTVTQPGEVLCWDASVVPCLDLPSNAALLVSEVPSDLKSLMGFLPSAPPSPYNSLINSSPPQSTAHAKPVFFISAIDLEGTDFDTANISPEWVLSFHHDMNMYVHISINIPACYDLYLY